jgi:hypothetical protein
MKFILQVFGVIVLAHMFEIFLPWYSIALAAFVMGYILRSRANFLAGFLGIALLWLFKAWMMNSGTATDLADRVAHIFSLSRTEWLLLVMAFVGGIVGGFAALSGALLKPKHRTYS